MDKTLTKDELSRLYDQKSVKEICDELNVSMFTFYALLDKAKIPRKKKHVKRTKWALVD